MTSENDLNDLTAMCCESSEIESEVPSPVTTSHTTHTVTLTCEFVLSWTPPPPMSSVLQCSPQPHSQADDGRFKLDGRPSIGRKVQNCRNLNLQFARGTASSACQREGSALRLPPHSSCQSR